MTFFFVWIILAILVGVYANNKGRSGIGFFFISAILSPLIGFIWALVIKPIHEEERQLASGENKKCPFCAEIIKKEAIVCKYCGKELPQNEKIAIVAPQTKEVKAPDEELMKKYNVSFSDGKYHYDKYKYDKLKDAIIYAKQQTPIN
jgi:hypothetical protein